MLRVKDGKVLESYGFDGFRTDIPRELRDLRGVEVMCRRDAAQTELEIFSGGK